MAEVATAAAATVTAEAVRVARCTRATSRDCTRSPGRDNQGIHYSPCRTLLLCIPIQSPSRNSESYSDPLASPGRRRSGRGRGMTVAARARVEAARARVEAVKVAATEVVERVMVEAEMEEEVMATEEEARAAGATAKAAAETEMPTSTSARCGKRLCMSLPRSYKARTASTRRVAPRHTSGSRRRSPTWTQSAPYLPLPNPRQSHRPADAARPPHRHLVTAAGRYSPR